MIVTGRRNTSLTFALCASITVHGLLLWFITWWFVKYTPSPHLSALLRPDDWAPIIVQTAPPPPPPPPPAKQQPPPPKSKEDFANAVKPPPRDDSGEVAGKGTANRSTPGEQPMQAMAGLEQANLTRSQNHPDDADKSKLEDPSVPAQAGVPNGADVSAQAAASFGVPEPAPVPAATATGQQNMIAMADPTQARNPLPPGDSSRQGGVVGSPLAPKNAVATPNANAIPPKEINGHNSISSDTDSMPFARANSVRFHDGKLEGRQGRRVKTTRIPIGLGGRADAAALADPSVVLGVTVNAGGNVEDVIVLRSSGSANIDQPCKSEVYNWWFEPKKDKDGHGLADLWVVTID